MPYSSSLTDAEWEILEPLLAQILPQKKRTRPSNWTKREIQGWNLLSTQEWMQLARLAQRLPPLQGRFTGTCIQWRAAAVIETLMQTLDEQVRSSGKKSLSGLG